MIAFLYPGQGAQHAGMLADLPDSAAARRTLEEAADLLPAIGGLDTAEALASTTNAQLALLICGVATARTLADEHGVSPDIVAGHSVGAFAAAVGAGVLTFSEAVAAVKLRGDSMARACASGQWGMAALTGLRLRVGSRSRQRRGRRRQAVDRQHQCRRPGGPRRHRRRIWTTRGRRHSVRAHAASRCSTSPLHRTGHYNARPHAWWHSTFRRSRAAVSGRPT